MHRQWKNWTECLLARAINLQLEVNDRWDGKKKSWFFGTLEQNCLSCVRVPPAHSPRVAPEELLPFWVSQEEQGSSSPADKPCVLVGPCCAHQASPGKFQS